MNVERVGSTSSEAPHLVAFGKYLLLERIAVGGMAEVWLGKIVKEREVSDLIAIKRVLSRYSDDEEFLRMFIDEARIAGQLAHRGIVPIHELGRVGRALYIAMEFVWGRDLLGILRRLREQQRECPAVLAAYVGAQVCETLHYAHTAHDREGRPLNVIHRDVSPQNVLVGFGGEVKVIDFGIAKAASRSTRTRAGTLKGKVGYMSPEQVSGIAVDHRSDQFALGTCMYEMITGRPLFTRPNNFESMSLVREANVRPLHEVAPHCPPELSALVARALSRDRQDRFSSALELHHALVDFIENVGPHFDRAALVAQMNLLFAAERAEEKQHLDALDRVGHRSAPQPRLRRNSSALPETAEDERVGALEFGATDVWSDSPTANLMVEVRREGTAEVLFLRDELDARRPRIEATDRALAWVQASNAAPATGGDSVVGFDPAQINSQVVRSLLSAARAEVPRSPPREVGPPVRPDASSGLGPKRSDTLFFAVAAISMAAIGAAATYGWLTSASTSTIEVRTIPPSDGAVLVDNIPRGRAPVRVEGLAPGRHQVSFLIEGYPPTTREVHLSPRSNAVLELTLSPLSQ